MKKRLSIIDNTQDMECYHCLGQGNIPEPNHLFKLQAFGYYYSIQCPTCKGTGVWKEGHYYLIDNKNKIAFDIDNPGQ